MSFIIILLPVLVVVFLIYAITPCTSRREMVKKYDRAMFAHRGYHNIEAGIPENSILAFQAALDHGYGIELDLHHTKDGKVVVFHDDDLKRICGDSGSVETYTYEELQQFRLSETEEHVPLFSEVLELVHGQVPLLIELKIPSRDTAVCPASYALLKNYEGDYMIQSFNTLGLRWFRKNAPHVLRGQLSSNLTKSAVGDPYLLRFFVRFLLSNAVGRPDFISYKLKDLPNISVSLCRKLYNVPIAVWTLRTPDALKKGQDSYNMCIFEKKGENY